MLGEVAYLVNLILRHCVELDGRLSLSKIFGADVLSSLAISVVMFFFFFQAEDGIRDLYVTGVQTCALPISANVPMRDAGSARLGMIVAETFRRNRKITITTRQMVRTSVNLTSCTDSRIGTRSEERRVGKEERTRRSTEH